jgi:alpha,alpha-trehalase
MDFAEAARILSDKREIKRWTDAANKRRDVMMELMWDSTRGMFFDYNYVKKRRSSISSLAAYYPMWAGMLDGKQAAKLVKSLRKFRQKGGLATTDNLPIGQYVFGALPMQWAYPNGWAPLHFLVVQGLQRYGYQAEARDLALTWLHTNLHWFKLHGNFLEKYNVVRIGEPPAKGVYPSQTGFGWTNAVFERFCRDFLDTPETPDK